MIQVFGRFTAPRRVRTLASWDRPLHRLENSGPQAMSDQLCPSGVEVNFLIKNFYFSFSSIVSHYCVILTMELSSTMFWWRYLKSLSPWTRNPLDSSAPLEQTSWRTIRSVLILYLFHFKCFPLKFRKDGRRGESVINKKYKFPTFE